MCVRRGLDPSGLAQVKQRRCLVSLVRLPQSWCSPCLCGCECITVSFKAVIALLKQISGLPPFPVPPSAFQSSLGEQVLNDIKWPDVPQQLNQCTAALRGSQDLFPVLQGQDVGPQHQMFLFCRFTLSICFTGLCGYSPRVSLHSLGSYGQFPCVLWWEDVPIWWGGGGEDRGWREGTVFGGVSWVGLFVCLGEVLWKKKGD